MCGKRLRFLLAAVILLKVPFFPDKTDQCGPATLASVLSFWGKAADPRQLRSEMYLAKLHGTLPMDLMLTAEAHGLKTEMARGDLEALRSELKAGRPVLTMLNRGFSAVPVDHYVVVTGFNDDREGLYMHSAGKENQFISYKKFLREWEKADYWTMQSPASMTRRRLILLLIGAYGLSACAGVPPMSDFHDPLSSSEHVSLGDAYLSHGEKKSAVQQYQLALDRDRRCVPALTALGNLAFDDRQWTAARHYFRRALKAAPQNPGLLNNLAMVDVAEGTHLDRAQRLIDQALPTAGPLTPYLLDTQAQIARLKS